MANITTTSYDVADLELFDVKKDVKTITWAATGDVAKGTLLALDTSTDKYILFVQGGTTNGNGVASAVLPYDVTVSATGDEDHDVIIGGELNSNKLIIAADGDNSNMTEAEIASLRDYGIIAKDVEDLSVYDNE